MEENDQWKRTLIGRNPYMYYETYQVTIQPGCTFSMENDGEFSVMALVDGETACFRDKDHPDRQYKAGYLDVIALPAAIDVFEVQAPADHPATLHLTRLKKGERKWQI